LLEFEPRLGGAGRGVRCLAGGDQAKGAGRLVTEDAKEWVAPFSFFLQVRYLF